MKIDEVGKQRILTVLKDSVEKLQLLGSITPDVFQHRDELSRIMGDEISETIGTQKGLEKKYAELITLRNELKMLPNKTEYKEIQQKIADLSGQLRECTKNLCHYLQDNPNVSGNLMKIQRERNDCIEILHKIERELIDQGTFHCLTKMVSEDKVEKNMLDDLIRREREISSTVRKLETDLSSERTQHKKYMIEQKKLVAELKDDLRNLKMRSSVDIEYMRREAHARIASINRAYGLEEIELQNRVKNIEKQLSVENEAHDRTMEFLKAKQQELQDDQVMWQNRYETDYSALQKELEVLTDKRTKVLERLQVLQRRRDMEIQEEKDREEQRRQEEEREKQRLEREDLENLKAIRIQRFFRFVVKKRMEELHKNKKDKKGKGKGKGKGKKKGKK